MKARLVLEDGTIFHGQGFGAKGTTFGEVVFNTGMTGYQEILTDPSYCGQIVTMTYPLIGNYGINDEDFESRASFIRGFVVKEACEHPSNWRSGQRLFDYLEKNNIIGIAGLDTRALTRRLRNHGTMRGAISTEDISDAEILAQVQDSSGLSGQQLVKQVTTPETFVLEGEGPKVVLMDFGAKDNIARSLNNLGCHVTVVPCDTNADTILGLNPDGIMLSNGPGDPKDVPYAVETVKALMGKKPIFGICLGHQILGLAFGADSYKLKFGHRGSNHPVKELVTGQVYITSQNHGYAIDENTLPADQVVVSHRNLNDNTVEGLEHKTLPIFSVQYHPEAAPGPEDSAYLFNRFLDNMNK